MEIGLRFVNLATPDAFESRNHSHSTGSEIPRPRKFFILLDMEQYFKAVRAPFDDQVTMATMSLSGDAKNIGTHSRTITRMETKQPMIW